MAPPPSTASSTSSTSSSGSIGQIPPPTVGTNRERPLQPPKALFYIDERRGVTAESSEDIRQDPFQTPDPSAPGTPRSVASNPFSPPASVISFSAEQNIGIHSASSTEHRPHMSRGMSRVSVQSALRNSTTDLQVREVERSEVRSNVSSTIRSSFMSPPMLPRRATIYEPSAVASGVSIPITRAVKRSRSTMLTSTIEKPWLKEKDVYARIAYFLTYGVALLGVAGSAIQCYFGWKNVPRVGNLCLVMEDDFDTFDTQYTWSREVDMGGFGNGEFEMTTDSSNNSFVKDGMLYIVPTLTSDVIGTDAIFNGYTYNISGCTNTNLTSCGAVSNSSTNTVINPVMSARITTKKSHSIRYGRVDIRAKLPRGDWLWPALWMLPVTDTIYGPWPASGEIDIMESRGNSPSYSAQGNDVVRGSLNWGPFSWLNGVSHTYGWWSLRRTSYADGFHTFSLEWTDEFLRIFIDTRLHPSFQMKFNEPFFQRGKFPPTVAANDTFIVTPDPWVNGTKNVAPFDQPFYLIMNVAVGGTNGWFPDNVGNKPWLDGSTTAMYDFARQQNTWYSTWPQDIEDRALVVDYVKMWQKC